MGTFDVDCGMSSNVNISIVISLVLKDSDTDSENVSFDRAFCIRWPENMQFKGFIIDTFIVN